MSGDATSAMLERIEQDNVRFLHLQFTDLIGMPKNVAIPVKQAEKALTSGIGFDGSSIEGFVRIEESDMVLKPDLSTYTLLPWGPGSIRWRALCATSTRRAAASRSRATRATCSAWPWRMRHGTATSSTPARNWSSSSSGW
ncbi:protein of unknown function [Methanoculleus bourgensis]|uniref:GS beta-grasp domain-containing protein n=1 Tax=Methanoculleus bourgensis TaxID=83986 RepID=A0A0X3BNT5_9EURY|nr:protein of unknown function [Methanoculleus bourgensis]